jgi:ECF sigma factor
MCSFHVENLSGLRHGSAECGGSLLLIQKDFPAIGFCAGFRLRWLLEHSDSALCKHSVRAYNSRTLPRGLHWPLFCEMNNDVTRILDAARRGDAAATQELLPLVYDELRRIAAHKMAHEAAGHTLQATALVHEVWLRLAGPNQQEWQNRAHFFGAAAEAMRRV